MRRCSLSLIGRDKNSYYHEYFLRGKRFLSNDIQRIKKKGNGARKPSSPLSEPDFYAMHYVLDTNEVMTYGRSDQMVSTIPRVEYVDRASSCDHFGGCLPESYVVHFPSSASALHTFAPRRMFPSESSVSQLFLPSLALSAVTNKAHYPSSAVSGAMLHMHAAMPPPTAAMLNEYSRHVRSADTQSQAGNQRASHVDHNFTPTKHQEYAHSIEHDQRLAAWIHYGGGGI